jgi:hypothetical protein
MIRAVRDHPAKALMKAPTLFLLLALAACARPPDPDGYAGSYRFTTLGEGFYHLRLEGRERIAIEDLHRHFHNRAAWVASQDGCRGYRVLQLDYGDRQPWFVGRSLVRDAQGVVQCIN